MKTLILICGDLAAGKSTYANYLSKKTSIVCYNKDNLKEILGDIFPNNNREENLKLSKCTFSLFTYILMKTMVTENDLILESNFREHEFSLINEMCKEKGYRIVSIIIRCDIHLLHQRFLNRINNENRHPVHKQVDYSCYEDFEKQILSDRIRTYPGENYFLQSDNFDDLYNDSVYRKIYELINKGKSN